jgi:hypothetical protein
MRRTLALVAVAVAVAFGAATAVPHAAGGPLASAKPCSAGWTHAVIGGAHKCLRSGQFCTRTYDRQYHRYGYHCHRYDARVDRHRLSR